MAIGQLSFGDVNQSFGQTLNAQRYLSDSFSRMGATMAQDLAQRKMTEEYLNAAPLYAEDYKKAYQDILTGNPGQGISALINLGASSTNPFLQRQNEQALKAGLGLIDLPFRQQQLAQQGAYQGAMIGNMQADNARQAAADAENQYRYDTEDWERRNADWQNYNALPPALRATTPAPADPGPRPSRAIPSPTEPSLPQDGGDMGDPLVPDLSQEASGGIINTAPAAFQSVQQIDPILASNAPLTPKGTQIATNVPQTGIAAQPDQQGSQRPLISDPEVSTIMGAELFVDAPQYKRKPTKENPYGFEQVKLSDEAAKARDEVLAIAPVIQSNSALSQIVQNAGGVNNIRLTANFSSDIKDSTPQFSIRTASGWSKPQPLTTYDQYGFEVPVQVSQDFIKDYNKAQAALSKFTSGAETSDGEKLTAKSAPPVTSFSSYPSTFPPLIEGQMIGALSKANVDYNSLNQSTKERLSIDAWEAWQNLSKDEKTKAQMISGVDSGKLPANVDSKFYAAMLPTLKELAPNIDKKPPQAVEKVPGLTESEVQSLQRTPLFKEIGQSISELVQVFGPSVKEFLIDRPSRRVDIIRWRSRLDSAYKNGVIQKDQYDHIKSVLDEQYQK